MSILHRVRSHVWRLGRLEVKDALFATLEEALAFAENADGHSVKIYDHTGAVTHVVANEKSVNTYA